MNGPLINPNMTVGPGHIISFPGFPAARPDGKIKIRSPSGNFERVSPITYSLNLAYLTEKTANEERITEILNFPEGDIP